VTSKKNSSCRFGRYVISKKKAFRVNSGAIIFKSKHVGRHFCLDFQGVLESFQTFRPDFRRFCPDFMAFLPNQNFWGAVAPPASPPPTPVVITALYLVNGPHSPWGHSLR